MKTLKVAYIEDNVDSRNLLGLLVKMLPLGEIVVDFHGYNNVQEFLNETTFDEDILFVDYLIPDMTGGQFLENYSNNFKPSALLVLLTAQSQEDLTTSFLAFMKTHKIEYVTKPLCNKEIKNLISTYTNKWL